MTAVQRWSAVYLVGAVPVAVALWDRAFLAWLLVGSAVCAVAGWKLYRARPSVQTVLLLASVVRLLAFAAPPSLSDDGYRYLWDGYVQQSGVSPFAIAPADGAELGPPVLLERMNSSTFFSVYPPVSQAAFALSTVWSSDWRVAWYVWKLICLAGEAVTACLLVRLAGSGGALLYLLHPLSWIEAIGQAHSEALMVPALLGAVWMVRRRDLRWLAGASMALAALVKLYPLVLLPLFARSRHAWAVSSAALLALSAAYLSPETIRNGLESVRLFGVYFEFNGGPYIVIKAALWEWVPPLAPHASRLLLVVFGIGGSILGYRYRNQPVSGAFWISALYLACSATVHPWYALGLLALAPMLRPVPLWLPVWCLLTLTTYSRYVWGDEAYGWSVALTWVGAVAAASFFGLQGLKRRLGHLRQERP